MAGQGPWCARGQADVQQDRRQDGHPVCCVFGLVPVGVERELRSTAGSPPSARLAWTSWGWWPWPWSAASAGGSSRASPPPPSHPPPSPPPATLTPPLPPPSP